MQNGTFFEACRNGNLEVVKYLVSQGCDPKTDDNNNLSIRYASLYDHTHVIKYLVSIGCDPKANDNLAIQIAIEKCNLDLVDYLIGVGCDPKADDNYGIRWSSNRGNIYAVKYLLELGCDHKDVKKEYKYEALQDVKIRLIVFMCSVQNTYIKMGILKRIIPCFTEKQIMNVLN